MFKSGVVAAAMLAALSSGAALAEEARSQYNLPPGVTEISREVHMLHNGVLIVMCVIAVLVFGAMIYSIINHRRSKHPKPADFHESVAVEIAWTLAPFVVLVGLAIPAAGTLIKMEDTRDAELTVKVTGFQWGWKYEYVGENYEFVSMLAADSNKARQLDSGIDPRSVPNYLWEVTNPLALPVGKKVRFLITGQDVIHAWWVFDLAVKKDAIPGYINEAWTKIDEPGTYRGVCAELCGRDHGFMPIVVQAMPENEFKTWLANKKGVDVASLGKAPPVAESTPVTTTTSTAPAPTEGTTAATSAASAQTLGTAVAISAQPGPAKIYFATGAKDAPVDTGKKIEALVAYAKANSSAKLSLSGFHDAKGSPEKNAELAKQRALSVKAALVAAGVAESAIEMKKPEQMNGGDAAEARRVDVAVAGGSSAAATTPVATEVAAATPAAAAVSTKALGKDELMAAGKKVYDSQCAACHQATGAGMPPNFPSLIGSKVVNGPAKEHIVHTIKGKGLMPPFGQLSDADIAAVVSYERNSWGNKASLVQASDVTAARK